MIMGLRGHNAKHYCNYCNICGYSNGKHIYCPLQSPKNLASSLGPKQNYSACNLPLRSHDDDYETAVYLHNHADLEFSQSTGIKDFTLLWNLLSLEWPWYDFFKACLKKYVMLTALFLGHTPLIICIYFISILHLKCVGIGKGFSLIVMIIIAHQMSILWAQLVAVKNTLFRPITGKKLTMTWPYRQTSYLDP